MPSTLATVTSTLAALTWEPQIKGGLYVVLSVVILVGSAYLLLGTNVGSKLGFQLTAAGLFGFFVTIGLVWWVYGIGPVGPSPSWVVQDALSESPTLTDIGALEGFPQGWNRLEVTDPEVADAQPPAEAVLVPPPGEGDGFFDSTGAYVLVDAYQKGGETHGPLGLDFRPFNLFHRPNYLILQAQHVLEVETPPGEAPRAPEADPSAPVVSVIMLRDLGSERLNPGVFTISSALIFGLLVWQLHTRDKEALRRKQAKLEKAKAATEPEKVGAYT